ncbi:hypothetical protein ABW20_dc0107248 [Dactylellina cionopaga]|nr:hypothetical protein ABW20_dc0107248 [Dactylellina cionopaga]
MSSPFSSFRYIPVFASLVQAKLPFPSGSPSAKLKSDDGVTFDPLAVAAILSNPRADLSAARLYIQLDREVYHWPHTMMIGGALPPMNALVAHLSTNLTSIHPAITMCGKDVKFIPVRSDMIFKELPVNISNYRLNDLIEFRSSLLPGNDFMVVNVDDLDKTTPTHFNSPRSWLGRLALDFVGLLTGLLLASGVAFAVLTADIWAASLFFFYMLHWLASTLISFTEMIRVDVKGTIVPDATPRYAVYQRPEGGTVVFKGRKEALERWARGTLEFKKNRRAKFFHWFWMTSGTAAAVSSVACMVNMRGYMQLGFLAVLLYSSLAEILATQISRNLQTAVRGTIFHSLIENNKFRTRGIIRATVEPPPNCRLKGLNWIALELLPNWPLYEEMQLLLARINEIQEREAQEDFWTRAEADVESAIDSFLKRTISSGDLAQRIADEALEAWGAWSAKRLKQVEETRKPDGTSNDAEV